MRPDSFQPYGLYAGAVTQAFSSFILIPNRGLTGMATITPMGTAATGLWSVVLSFNRSSAAQRFTLTPTAMGSIGRVSALQGSASRPEFLPPATFFYTAH